MLLMCVTVRPLVRVAARVLVGKSRPALVCENSLVVLAWIAP
jgi:hypothetical protein